MARSAAFVFCHYQILDQNENPLSAKEEFEAFEVIAGQPVAYHVREPKPDDQTTYLMKARLKRIFSYTVRYDKRTGETRIDCLSKYKQGPRRL